MDNGGWLLFQSVEDITLDEIKGNTRGKGAGRIEDGTADNAEKSRRPLPIPKNDTNTTMKGIVAIAKRPRKNVIPQDEVVKMR